MSAKRFKTKENAKLEVYGHIGNSEAKMRNLSATGAYLEVNHGEYVPRKGDLLNLTVELNSLKRVYNVAAEVIWSNGLGLGICFIHKDDILERMMAKAGVF
ncbi:PilZ domain-containing protein [Bdellovibrio sp. GT3]|uniref:PilZ domain-containing protein n=1 Tax=unclassified Bdellovibrio TaxID=2633795 RepID=UPI0030F07958